MKVVLRLICCVAFSVLVSAAVLAQDLKLKSEQIKKFDESFAAAEKTACLASSPTTRETWLTGELTKLNQPSPTAQPLTRQVWSAQTPELKIDGEAQTALWVRGSPGTYGTLSGAVIKAGADKAVTALTGGLTDAGEGTVADLNSAKDASGTFWLVEMSDAIPEERALAIEAKNRGALGLILYGVDTSDLNLEAGGAAALPMITIEDKVAKGLKTKIKSGVVNVSLSLKTDYPVAETGHALLVKKGARDEQVFFISRGDNCDDISETLAVLRWTSDSGVDAQGTTFAFVDGQDFGDHMDDWAHPATSVAVMTIGTSSSDRAKFLNAWFKADQNPDSAIDIKPVLKKAENLHSVLKGLISGEDLKKYHEDLQLIEKPATVSKLKARLVQLYESNSFTQIADELRKLREIHALAEKGMYDQAAAELKKVSDFRWADNVSPETFLAYEKQRSPEDVAALDPALWVESRKGKGNLDALLVVLEREIDRLDKALSDNFFKLQKSIEQFRNI